MKRGDRGQSQIGVSKMESNIPETSRTPRPPCCCHRFAAKRPTWTAWLRTTSCPGMLAHMLRSVCIAHAKRPSAELQRSLQGNVPNLRYQPRAAQINSSQNPHRCASISRKDQGTHARHARCVLGIRVHSSRCELSDTPHCASWA